MATNGATGGNVTWAGINRWLMIVVALVSIAVGIGVFQGQVTAIRTQVDFNTTRIDTLVARSQSQEVILATMAQDLAYIRAELEHMEEAK